MKKKIFATYYGEYSLYQWIEMILTREIVLPDFQRYFVWTPEKVVKLLESLDKGLFIPPVIIANQTSEKDNNLSNNYVLDGQQRLSAILLAYLQVFPVKFDDYSLEVYENDDNTDDSGNSIEDDFEDRKILKWNFGKVQNFYENECEHNIKKLKEDIMQNGHYVKFDDNIVREYKTTTTKIIERYKNIKIDKNFLKEHFLGFSYIKAIEPCVNNEKSHYAEIFRNINTSAVQLLPEESRSALYWLAPNKVPFFKPDFLQDVNVNNKKLDFARLLAYVADAYQINKSESRAKDKYKRLAKGYSLTRRYEEYIELYVNNVINNEVDERFGDFSTIFPNYEDDLSKLKETFLNHYKKTKFSNLVEADYYLFGLLYWQFFSKKQIDFSKSYELFSRLNKAISVHRGNKGEKKHWQTRCHSGQNERINRNI